MPEHLFDPRLLHTVNGGVYQVTNPHPTRPNFGREIWLIRGNPRPDVGSYYLCPDREHWSIIGIRGEVVPLEVARALGE